MMLKVGKGSFYFKSLTFIVVAFFFSVFFLAQADAKSIKVGIIGPMKSIEGKHQWLAADMGADEINKAGGIKIGKEKYTIELVKIDSNELASIPDAVTAYQRVIGNVDFMIGGCRSEAVLAMMEVMADNKKILMSAGAASSAMAKKVAENYDRYKYFFKAGCVSAEMSMPAAFLPLKKVGDKIRKELGVKKPKLAIMADKAMWCEQAVKVIQAKAPEMGFEVIGVWRPSFAAGNVMPELTAIKNAGAHIIYTYAAGPAGIAYAKQWGELEIPAFMLGVNIESLRLSFWQQTAGTCNYQTAIGYFAPIETTPKSKMFFDKFVKETGDAPTLRTTTYDGLYILKDAAERAGTLETEALIKSLEKTKYQGTQGTIAYYPRGHQFPHDLQWGADYITFYYLQWKNGKQNVVWPHGDPELGGLKFKGGVDFELPPWMIKYWKAKK